MREYAKSKKHSRGLKKRSSYKKSLLVYSGGLLAAAAVFLCFMWIRCSSYQLGQSDDAALRYVGALSKDDWMSLLSSSVYGGVGQTKQDAAKRAYEILKNGKFEAFRSSKKTGEEQKKSGERLEVCNVTCSGIRICSVTLKENGRGAFGEPRWKATELKLDGSFLNTVNPKASVLLPVGCELSVNGAKVGELLGEAAVSPFATVFEKNEKTFSRYNFRVPCGKYEAEAFSNGERLIKKDLGENLFAFDFPDKNKVKATISVPSGSAVYVNGVQLTRACISAENVKYPFISPLEENRADAPKSTEYEVKSLYKKPCVRAVYGKSELSRVESDDHLYLFRLKSSGADYRLTVPDGVSVFVNGNDVTKDERFIALSGIEYSEVSKYRDELINPKVCRSYIFKGLLLKPDISVTDTSGQQCPLVQTGKTDYECNLMPLSGDVSEYEALAKDFGVAMMEYMFLGKEKLDDGFHRALSFIRKSSGAYDVLKNTYVGMYWRKTHTIEYNRMYVDNYISYADNAFRCDLHYDVTGTRVTNNLRKDHVVGIYRLLYLKGADGWKIAELSLLKEDE